MAAINLATYPLSISTTVEPDWGIVQDYADNGALHMRELFAARYFVVNANWGLLDTAGRDALESLLLLYRMEDFTFTFDGHAYTGKMISPPSRRYVSGQLYALSAAFRATRASA